MKVQVTTLENCELVIFAETEERKKELAFEILNNNAEESKDAIINLLTDAQIAFAEDKGFIIGARPKGIPGR